MLLCKNAPKLNDVLAWQEKELKELEEKVKAGLSQQEHRRELNRIRMGCLKDLAKIFGAGTIMWLCGMGILWTSNITLQKRHAAALTALATVTANFDAYRARVREKYGAGEDYILRTGQEYKEEIIETGEGKKTKKSVVHQTPVKESVKTDAYTRIFDASNPYWFEEDLDQNLVFLKQRQNWLTDKLHAKFTQTLLFNEALEDTGFKGTKIGAHAGWTLRKQDGKRDGVVDLGVFDPKTGLPYDHVLKTLHEQRYIVLDYNVDGYVLEDGFDE